jgi:hypothetical protein
MKASTFAMFELYVNSSTQAFLLSENRKSSEVIDEAVSILLSFKKEKYSLTTGVQEVLVLRVLTLLIFFGKSQRYKYFVFNK